MLSVTAAAALVAGAGLYASQSAKAQSWTGAADTTWMTPGNWSPPAIPNAAGAMVQFDTTVAPLNGKTISLGGNVTVGGISVIGPASITKDAFAISGNTLTFNNGGAGADLTLGNGLDLTIASAISLADDLTIANNSAWGGNIAITGAVSGNGKNIAVNVLNSTSFVTLGSTVSGSGTSIHKTGSGSLALNAANTFTGGVTLDAGTLVLGNNAALGSGVLTLTTSGSAKSLATAAGANIAIGNSIVIGSDFSVLGGGTLTLNGSGTTTIGGSRTIFVDTLTTLAMGSNQALSGGALNKTGAGTLVLSNGNSTFSSLAVSGGKVNTGTFSGAMTIGAAVAGQNYLGTGAIEVDGIGNGVLNINGTVGSTLTVGGSVISLVDGGVMNVANTAVTFASGTVDFGTGTTKGVMNFSGPVSLGNSVFINTAGATMNLAGNLTFLDGTTIPASGIGFALNGTGPQTINAQSAGTSVAIAGSFAKTNAGTATLDSSITSFNVAGAMTLSGGLFDAGTAALTVPNGVTLNGGMLGLHAVNQYGGSFNAVAGTSSSVLLNGANQSFSGVTIASGSSVLFGLGGNGTTGVTLSTGTVTGLSSGILRIADWHGTLGSGLDTVQASTLSAADLSNVWFKGYARGAQQTGGVLTPTAYLDSTWSNGAGDLKWFSAGNWVGGDSFSIPNSPGAIARMSSIGGIISNQNIDLGGQAVTLGQYLISTTGASANITNGSFIMDSGSAGVSAVIGTMGGGILPALVLNSNTTLQGTGTALRGAISGSGTLTVKGGGNVFYAASGSYTGGTIIDGGYVGIAPTNASSITNGTWLGTGAVTITANGGTLTGAGDRLYYPNTARLTNQIILNGNLHSGQMLFDWNGNVDLSSTRTIYSDGGESLIPGYTNDSLIFGTGFNFTGVGGLILTGPYTKSLRSGNSTFSGGLTLNQGQLNVPTVGGVTIGALDADHNYLGTGNVTVTGGTSALNISGNAAVRGGTTAANNNSILNISGGLTLSGGTVKTDATGKVLVGTDVVFDGATLTTLNMTLAGTANGTLSATGNTSGTISGITNLVNSGTGVKTLDSSLAQLQVANTVSVTGGILRLTRDGQLTASTLMLSGGALDANGHTASFNTLSLGNLDSSLMLGNRGGLTFNTRSTTWSPTATLSLENNGVVTDWNASNAGSYVRFVNNPFNLVTDAALLAHISFTGFEPGATVTQGADSYYYLLPNANTTYEWTGGADPVNNWGTATNWLPGAVPNAVGASATFRNLDTNLTGKTVNVDGTYTIARLNISSDTAANFTFGGAGTLVFSGSNAAINQYTSAVTYASAMRFDSDTTLNTTVSGANNAMIITGPMSGTGTVSKAGGGFLKLGGNAAGLTGNFNWQDGSHIALTANGALFGSGTLVIGTASTDATPETLHANGGARTVNLSGGYALQGNLNVDGGWNGAAFTGSNYGITLSGNGSLSSGNHTIRVFSNGTPTATTSLVLDGVISGSGGLVINSGSSGTTPWGSLEFTKTNTFTGDVSWYGGNIFLDADNALGQGTLNFVMGGASNLTANTSVTLKNRVVFNSPYYLRPTGMIHFDADSSVVGNSQFLSNVVLSGYGTMWFGKNHVLEGTGGFAFSNINPIVVMQGANNTFTGGIAAWYGGIVVVGASSTKNPDGTVLKGPLGTGVLNWTNGDGMLLVYSDTAGVTSQTLSNPIVWTALKPTFGAWTGGGTNYANTVILDAPTTVMGSIPANLSLNVNNITARIDSQILDNAGVGGFTKIGTGTLALTNGDNQLDSGVIANAGTLLATGNGDLVTGTTVAGQNMFGRGTITGSGSGTVIATNMGGNVYLRGSGLTLNNGATFFNQNAASITYLDSDNLIGSSTGGGTLRGAGTIAKIGAGTNTTVTTNIVTPNLSVASGTLTLGAANLISGVGGISLSGGTLNLSNTSQTFAGVIMVNDGGGTINFGSGAANSWFSAGSLSLNGNTLNLTNWSGNATNGLGNDRLILTDSGISIGTIYDTVVFGGGYGDGAKIILNGDGQKVLVPLGTAFIWTGQTNSSWPQANWKQYDPGNDTWSFTGMPTSRNDAVAFDNSDPTLNSKMITVDSDSILGSLSFNGTGAQAFAIGGATLTFDRAGDSTPINVSGNMSPTINSNIVLNFDLSKPTENNLVINQNGTGILTINGEIQGINKSMTKNGEGTLVLNSATSTFTNGLIMNAGMVAIGSSSVVDGSDRIVSGPLGIGTTTMNGGTLQAGGGAQVLHNALDIEGSFTVAGPNGLTFAGSLGATATVSKPATVTVSDPAGSLTFGANLPLTGSEDLTKDGAGALNFNEDGSGYSGNVIVNAGTVGIGTDNGFGAGTVTLANGTTLNSTGVNPVVANAITLMAGAETISADGTNNLTLNGVISGAATITKTGSATLTLGGNSVYTGGTVISGGAVTLTSATGAGSGAIAVGGNTLNLAFSGTGLATPTAFANMLTGTGTTNVTGDFIKLTGNNSGYTGILDINAGGSAIVSNTAALGGSSVVIDAGGMLNVMPAFGAFSFANQLSGAGTLAVQMSGGTDAFSFGATAANGFTGLMQLGTGSMDLNANASAALASATLQLDSGSTLTVGSAQSVGNFTMNGGTLISAVDPATGSFTGKITTGTFNASAGNVQLDLAATAIVPWILKADDGFSNQIVAATAVTGNVSSLQIVDINGNALGATSTRNIVQDSNTVAVATYSESLTTSGTGGAGLYVNYILSQLNLQAGQTLSLDEEDDTGTAAELKALVTGLGNLEIAASHAITISNAGNNYSGTTTISTGTAKAGIANVFKNTGDMIVSSGATLDLNSFDNQVNNLSGSGNVIASAMLTANNTVASSFSGVISGTSGVTKIGAGVLTLTNASTYSGSTNVAAGGLTLTNANAISNGAATVASGANLTLAFSGGSYANATSGTGTIAVTGANVAITGTNSFSGLWDITGSARVATPGNLGTGSVYLDGSSASLTVAPASGSFTFTNALTGTGTLIAQAGAGNAFAFDSTAGTAFTGTLDMRAGTFALSDQNTASLANATLLAGTGSLITVGSGTQTIGSLKFGGGTVIFDATIPAQTQADSIVNARTLDVNGTGMVQVNVPTDPGMPTVGTGLTNILSQEDGGAITKLAGLTTGGTVVGAGGGLVLIDQNDHDLQANDQSILISNQAGTAQAATGTYGYRLNTSTANDGLYVSYALKLVDILANQTLTLTPDTGATGLARDMSAKLTGAGSLELAAAAGQIVSVTNAANDYTGATTVTSGTFKAGSNNAMGKTSGLTITSGATTDMNGMSQTVGTFTGQSGSVLNLNGGTLTIAGVGTSAGTLTGAGTLALNGATAITGANAGLTAGVTIASAASATLDNVAGLGNTGTITNSGTMTLDGATGTLAKDVAGGGNVTLANGADVTLAGTNTLSGAWNVASGTSLTASTQANLGTATVNNAGTFDVNTSSNWTLTNGVTGAGTFVKDGIGTLTIARSNAMTGPANIEGGMLTLTNADGVGSGLVTVNTVAGSTTTGLNLSFASAQTFDNQLAGTGTTFVAGSPLATITGANSGYAGNWQITGNAAVAAAALTSADNLGSGAVNIASGGSLTTATTGDFTFNNALTGGGTLIARPGAGNAFAFATTAGTAFTGTLDMQAGTFALSDQNTASLAGATLLADTGSMITVGSGNQTIGSLRFGGGTMIFDATIPADRVATSTVTTTGNLDVSGTGTARVTLPVGGWNSGLPLPASQLALLEQDDADVVVKLVSSTGTVTGSAGNLTLADQDGHALSDAQTVAINQNGVKVADGTYDYRLTTGTDRDGLYVNYGLTELSLIGTGTDALVLAPATGAVGNAADMSAKLTGAGDVAIEAGIGNTVTLSDASNDYRGATLARSGTLQLTNSGVLGKTSDLNIAADAIVDMNGMVQSVGAVHTALGANLNLTGTLTITHGQRDLGDTDGGAIDNLTLAGDGRLVIDPSVVRVNGTQAGFTGAVQLTGGSQLIVNTAEAFNAASGIALDTATDTLTFGRLSAYDPLWTSVANGATVVPISGLGIVQVQDGSDVTLLGDNSQFAGQFQVASASTLRVSDPMHLGTAAVAVEGTLNINTQGYWSLANTVTGSGTVEKGDIGILSVDSALSGFTGLTHVTSGTLLVGETSATYSMTGNVAGSFGAATTGAGAVLGGAVQVDNGAVLSGTGTLTGPVQNNGVIASFNALPSINGYGDNSQTSNLTVGPLSNAGVVLLAGSKIGNTLTVTGGLTGLNGIVVMNTALGNDASATDKLILSGGATTGHTSLVILNQGGVGAATSQGIQVVQAINGASTTTDAFTLSSQSSGYRSTTSTLAVGAYEYSLVRGGNGGNGDSWYLTSRDTSGDGKKILRPEAGIYGANAQIARSMFMMTLHDREGYVQSNGGVQQYAGWGRINGTLENGRMANNALSTKAGTTTAQLGIDLFHAASPTYGSFYAGVMGGWGHSETDAKSRQLSLASASGSVNGYSIGAYGTWYQKGRNEGGAYIDTWAQYSWFNNQVRGGGLPQEKYDSHTVTASIEAGYSFLLYSQGNAKLFLEPQAQLAYIGYSADRHTEKSGTMVRFTDGNGLVARVGARLSGLFQRDNGQTIRPFIEANYWHNQKGPKLWMDNDLVPAGAPRSFGEVKAGVVAELSKNLQVSAQVSARIGGNRYNAVGGQLGLKYTW